MNTLAGRSYSGAAGRKQRRSHIGDGTAHMVECTNMFALNCILVLDFILSYPMLPFPTLPYTILS